MKVVTIGRYFNNNVVINDSTISRYHLQIIQHDDGHVTLLDMNSKNGTFVNGNRVYGEVRLKQNDIIQIGRTILPWRSYFTSSISLSKKGKFRENLLMAFGIVAGVMVTFMCIVLSLGKGNLFRYDSANIDTQVLVMFSDNVSDNYARFWLKIHGAQILDSNETFNYYFVCTRNEKAAKRLIDNLAMSKNNECAIQNQYLYPNGVKMFVLDDFGKPDTKQQSMSHGKMVAYTMHKGIDAEIRRYNINIDGKISSNEMTNDFINACNLMSDDDLNIVNISMGVSKYQDKEKKIEKSRDELIEDYANELKWYASMASKCNKQNFIITKSMGNEGEHKFDDAFIRTLKEMKPEQQQVLKNHFVIVAAKDTRKELPQNYSNSISQKVNGVNTIMVDLSDMPVFQNGTSAAAPLVANWIAKSDFKKASDVIEVINQATREGELVSENTFKENAKMQATRAQASPKGTNSILPKKVNPSIPQPSPAPRKIVTTTAEDAARKLMIAICMGDIATMRALTTDDIYNELMISYDSDMARLDEKVKWKARKAAKEIPAETIKIGKNTVVVRFKGNGKQWDLFMRNSNGWKCFDYARGGVHVPKSMRR